MPEIGQSVSHYRILDKLGAGGMGEVYRAQDTNLNRQVAIKVLPDLFSGDPERLARFEREAQLLASLNHPNIAIIFGMERVAREILLVMELVNGPTLAERLEKGPLPVDEALEIGRRIAEGLEAAHEKGIIHRDLKPANIKITPEGNVKILDFGLAKALTGEAEATSTTQSPTITEAMTRPGVILGTAAYMSPEQARGATVDKRADIWAFGVVLFEMLTGQTCFAGQTITDLLAAVVRAEPDWSKLPPGTPPRVRELLERCLAKDRRQRLRDIGDARLELEKAPVAGTEAAKHPESGPARSAGISKREIASWTLAALAIIAVVWLWVAGTGRQAVTDEPTYSYLMPPADSVSCFRDGFAVSPDGRKIAFSSMSSKGERLVWMQNLGSPKPAPLQGTNGATYPFWSPDSRSIGFFSNGWLKRIDVESGQFTSLCRASALGGSASWGRAGTIIFWTGTGLARISENPGEPGPTAWGSWWGSWPSFLADGNRFVFGMNQDSKNLAFIATTGQPGRQTQIHGITDVDGIQWAGIDLFMVHRYKERTLVAQRADLTKGEVVGMPVPIADRVPAPNGVPSFSVSPAGLAAYVVNPPEARNDVAGRLTWVDRKGNVLGTLGETGGYWSVRISPDGREVAVNPDEDIWIFDVATRNSVRFTREMDSGAFAYMPGWSVHGDHLLANVTGSGGGYGLRAYPRSGGQARDLDIKASSFGAPDWSRDERYVVFGRLQPNSDMADIAYYDFIDKQVKTFLATPAYESFGVLSPDSHWIAYASNTSGAFEVYVRPFPEGGQEKRVSFNGGMHPRWCRNGNELVFLTSDWSVMSAQVKLQPSLEIQAPVKLFDNIKMADIIHGMVAPYDVTPQGDRFLVIVPVQTAPVPLTLIQNWPALTKR
jgi:serine/threonine protein kinase